MPKSISTLSYPKPDLAVITLDDPEKGANVLSREILLELGRLFDECEKKKGLAGLIIQSAKPGIFIAGADINEFVKTQDADRDAVKKMSTDGRQLFERLSKMPFVTVAAIDGMCVGGGAELAVWSDRRVMSTSPKAQIGFPEVKLGIYPGWGGTVRTPRIIGLSNAIELIASGNSIDSFAAKAMGLADDISPSERLFDAAERMVRAEQKSGKYKADRERWAGPIEMSETEFTFLGATASAYIQGQTKGQYPAPLVALELMMNAAQVSADEAGEMEADTFGEVFGTPISRSLINVFFLTDRNKKDTGGVSGKGRDIKSVGVFGAGIMGSGIAGANLRRDLPVTISDANPPALANGVQKILEEVSYNKVTKLPDPTRMAKFAGVLNGTSTDAEFANCDLVIEAVVEKFDVKRDLFARIESVLKHDAIIASNTSAISISDLAKALKKPERFCGIHFFNPVRQMQLVEVVRGDKTSDETIATAVSYVKKLGKSPVVVKDGPGFLVNRLLLPYMNEAIELLLEGVEMKAIESAAKEFGMPMGPFTLYDVVGIDVAYHAGEIIHKAFPDRVGNSPLLEAMVKAGRLGAKTGKGFFDHTGKKGKKNPDPTLAEFLKPFVRGSSKLSGDEIQDRLFLPMVVEATRILEEGLVRDPRDVDLGLILGVGFPPFKGGLLFWADTIGAKKIVESLKKYENLGERYQPTSMLKSMAEKGASFYKAES